MPSFSDQSPWLAIAATIVAAAAFYIALQQWWINRERLRLDLFDRRFSVFATVRKALSVVLREAKFSDENLWEFRAGIAEREFLFGDDIVEYIDSIDTRLITFQYHQTMSRNREEPRRHEFIDLESQDLGWLTDQLPLLKPRFAPYMRFEDLAGGPLRTPIRRLMRWCRSLRTEPKKKQK